MVSTSDTFLRYNCLQTSCSLIPCVPSFCHVISRMCIVCPCFFAQFPLIHIIFFNVYVSTPCLTCRDSTHWLNTYFFRHIGMLLQNQGQLSSTYLFHNFACGALSIPSVYKYSAVFSSCVPPIDMTDSLETYCTCSCEAFWARSRNFKCRTPTSNLHSQSVRLVT